MVLECFGPTIEPTCKGPPADHKLRRHFNTQIQKNKVIRLSVSFPLVCAIQHGLDVSVLHSPWYPASLQFLQYCQRKMWCVKARSGLRMRCSACSMSNKSYGIVTWHIQMRSIKHSFLPQVARRYLVSCDCNPGKLWHYHLRTFVRAYIFQRQFMDAAWFVVIQLPWPSSRMFQYMYHW